MGLVSTINVYNIDWQVFCLVSLFLLLTIFFRETEGELTSSVCCAEHVWRAHIDFFHMAHLPVSSKNVVTFVYAVIWELLLESFHVCSSSSFVYSSSFLRVAISFLVCQHSHSPVVGYMINDMTR